MSRYYFDFWDGKDLLADKEGASLPNLEAVAARALTAARDLLCEEVRHGRVPLFMRIDVKDDKGKIVHQLDFKEAVKIDC